MKANLGAMYSLTHKKTNLMGQIKIAYEKLDKSIGAYESEQDVDGIVAAVRTIGGKIQELEKLDKQIAFLTDSGYEPDGIEAAAVALENSTMKKIAELVLKLEEKMAEGMTGIQEQLMETLREIREGQKGITAYFPNAEEPEGRNFDALR